MLYRQTTKVTKATNPQRSPLRVPGIARRGLRRLPRLFVCLLCPSFILYMLFLNALPPSIDDEGRTELMSVPPSLVKHNGSDMFSNAILRNGDRRVVILLVDSDADSELIETLLKYHSRVILLSDPGYILSSSAFSLLAGGTASLVDSLLACDQNALPVLVDVANAQQLRTGDSPWCSPRLRHTTNHKDVVCTPPSKLRFQRLCRANHVALKVNSVDELTQYLNLDTLRDMNCFKVVHLSRKPHDIKEQLFGQSQLISNYVNYHSEWSKNEQLVEKVMDLYNFLDLYLDNWTIQWLISNGFLHDVPTFPAQDSSHKTTKEHKRWYPLEDT